MYNILIVEDDAEINQLLTEFLKENGYGVVSQYDGLHVLDILRKNEMEMNLILLDLMLPYEYVSIIL